MFSFHAWYPTSPVDGQLYQGSVFWRATIRIQGRYWSYDSRIPNNFNDGYTWLYAPE